ncbi:Ig-like domain-containing protein [Chitinophaga japonensis]|uniref:Ig-like domain-containing protein n=1 Tax=Chitinophaga japonensis TaxID=104662 RepID=UPI00131509C2|nr:right-handed parallel beta-helix repeat-containing protein [Chitinophaga japonensis]
MLTLLLSANTYAQTDIAIGNGATGNTDWVYPCPLADSYDATRMQFLYLASELATAGMAAGNINAIRFRVTDLGMYVGANSAVDNMTVKIGTTASGSLNATSWEPGATVVYGPANHLPVMGNNSFPFAIPFFWNGTDNIVIEICTDAGATDSRMANPYVTWTTGLSFNGSHTIGENFNGNLCDAASGSSQGDPTTRPDIIFNWTAAGPCNSTTLTAGTAVASVPRACGAESFMLTLSGASLATGLSYQWQSSTDNVSWSNIPGATAAAHKASQAASTYYRAIVTCASGGSATSTAVQVTTPLPVSGTFTIDKTQPAGSGNFQSFNDAWNYVRCGVNGPVVFNVAASSGTYNEQLVLYQVPGSSATNTITFNGAAGAGITYTATGTNDRAVIKLDGGDHYIFNDLAVTAAGNGSSQYGYGFHLLNNADSNRISHCNISTATVLSGDKYAGIVVSSSHSSAISEGVAECDANVFADNIITGGRYGITLAGSSAVANGNNRITGNTLLDFSETGIYIACSFNTVVDSNYLSRPAAPPAAGTVNGIYVTNLNSRLTLSRNTITNMFGGAVSSATFYGICFMSAAGLGGGLENKVYNNLLYNINGGANVYGLYNSASHNTLYYHNTISLDGTGSGTTADHFARGFYQEDATGIRLQNNNIVVSRSGPGEHTAIWFNTYSSDIVSDHNNLYVPAGVGIRQTGYIHDTGRTSLYDWQTAAGLDAASASANPLFVDLAGGDLHPQDAALDNTGANAGIATDITGAARSAATPDIGAYEFAAPPCVVPPLGGSATLSQSDVCIGASVTLSLSGHSSGAGQTYQLESSTAQTGPFQPVGAATVSPEFGFTANTTLYYRVTVSCGGSSASSGAVLLTVHQAFPSGTYTINKNAPSGSGNFTSFNAAYGALSCGIDGPVVFNVVPGSGPYNEQLIMKAVRGASGVNTITFNGNGNVLQYSGDDTDQRAVIKLDGGGHFIIDSLIIDATGSGNYGYGVQLLNNADSNIVKSCVIKSSMAPASTNAFAGIVISAAHDDPTATGDTWCDDNLFESNTITGGHYGIAIAGDPVYFAWSSNFIKGNRVINNTVSDFYERGIYVIGTEATLIEQNIISRPSRAGVGDFYGMYLDQTNAALSVRRNRITNPFGGDPASTASFYGMYLDYSGHEIPANIINNLVYNINGAGEEYGIYSNGGRFLNILHNTISLDNTQLAGNNTAATNGFYISFAGDSVVFRNNIVTITRGGSGMKHGFNVAIGDVIPLVLDKNDYYINGAGGNNYIGYRNASRATLDEWRLITKRDLHSISEDPVYADEPSGDLTPTVAPLDNTGDPLGVLGDILGADRSTTTPDIGAYEFSPAPCISGVIAGTAAATPDSGMCMGSIITLSLTGNTVSGYQTYRWQRAATLSGPWEDISDTLYVPTFKTEALANGYYRCVVSCTGISDTSATAQVQLNAPLPGGVYTINPDGSGDYPSFNAAVAAMACGIGGAVTFDVAPGTYTEQVYMRRIAGASDTSRVTFRAANGDATAVTLTADGTTAANYVLKLDSASYITCKNISITATSGVYGRVVELAGTSSYDSLLNNIITTGATTATGTARAAIYGAPLKGKGVVIQGNTISNGSSGIYIAGTSINRSNNLRITSNTLSGFYQYGIYAAQSNGTAITDNAITMAAPLSNTAYGIYTADGDSAYQVSGNLLGISNATTTVYGISVQRSQAFQADPGNIRGNRIAAIDANAGNLYGLHVSGTANARIINNVISIGTSGNNSYGLYGTSNINAACYNNTVYSTATSANNNIAAYFTDGYDDQHYVDIRNNIFAHEGGGKALYLGNLQRFYSDYNLLYTTGGTLVQQGFSDEYATLADWRAGGDLDVHSIVYQPAFVNNINLEPAISSPDVWAMHGRGIQLNGNDEDIHHQPRPATLKAGVPDLGAYEFVPTSVPVASVPVPSAPAPNTTQHFMLGTDTVYTIQWGATVPSSITVRRYSGVMPPGLAPGTDYMYFYVDTDVTPVAPLHYTVRQHYLDPWRGFIDSEARIRLGRTDDAGAWTVDTASSVNTTENIITRANLDYIDKLTGLTNPGIAYPPTDSSAADTSNLGTRFWVGYGHNNNVTSLVVKVGGGDHDANVTVKVNGTSWVRQYHVPAHTFVTSDPIPRTGVSGAVLLTEGLSDRGILIESDEPVAAYAQADGILAVTGSTQLLPVGAYGYEYYALTWEQRNYDINVHSWFYVIADHDSTMVEITPSSPTLGGRQPGEPFVVTLQKGEVYQVLAAVKSENEGYDLSGSKIRAISNASGKCYPIAVFSGNSRGFIDCAESFVPFGNYLIQQNLPAQQWGTAFLTAPTSRAGTPEIPQTNYYRVLVKDPATVVTLNGAPLTGLVNNFYQYESADADYIEADKPVMVAQFIPGASVACDFGQTAPEMFYLPDVGHGIRRADFYRSAAATGDDNYLTLVIPTAGLPSLRIDGGNIFDSTYSHPNKAGYTVVVKRWEPANTTGTVYSDSAFTAIAYGLGGSNSYGFVLGRSISQLTGLPGITNVYDSSGNYSRFTCVGTPFRYSILLPVQPTRIVWQFSKATSNMVPDADSIQLNPVPVDTVWIHGRSYYRFELQAEYEFTATGQYTVPVAFTHPVIENCASTVEVELTVNVVGSPVADFDIAYSGCMNDVAQFTPDVSAENGDVVNRFLWNFGDSTTSIEQAPVKEYTAPGNYTVTLRAITQEGCVADTAKPLEAKEVAVFSFVQDTVIACPGTGVTLAVADPATGVVYNWYDALSGGDLVHTGSSLTIAPLTATQTYYVSADLNGCVSRPRQAVTGLLAPAIAVPVLRVDSLRPDRVRFAWDAVPGADSYQVSTNNGTTWITPSSGPQGLFHIIAGLQGGTAVSLMVKAIDPNGCGDGISEALLTHTLPGQLFIPNAFTPNGDGLNDLFKVEGYVRSVQLQVFNQWGEKVFESADQARGWDDSYKGTLQPSGVYIYVCSIILDDGSKVLKKGAIHLIR